MGGVVKVGFVLYSVVIAFVGVASDVVPEVVKIVVVMNLEIALVVFVVVIVDSVIVGVDSVTVVFNCVVVVVVDFVVDIVD